MNDNRVVISFFLSNGIVRWMSVVIHYLYYKWKKEMYEITRGVESTVVRQTEFEDTYLKQIGT